jgi:dephospho-CoA kinase
VGTRIREGLGAAHLASARLASGKLVCVPTQGSLVILTGASGSGKTAIAEAFEAAYSEHCQVRLCDSIGVPHADVMKAFGEGHQPGGAWQRAITLQWIGGAIPPLLASGKSVLFEGQMRIAFITEALRVARIDCERVILVDCSDAVRVERLTHDRRQPELADANMMGWATYLRDEALAAGCEILDTSERSIDESVRCIAHAFNFNAVSNESAKSLEPIPK